MTTGGERRDKGTSEYSLLGIDDFLKLMGEGSGIIDPELSKEDDKEQLGSTSDSLPFRPKLRETFINLVKQNGARDFSFSKLPVEVLEKILFVLVYYTKEDTQAVSEDESNRFNNEELDRAVNLISRLKTIIKEKKIVSEPEQVHYQID